MSRQKTASTNESYHVLYETLNSEPRIVGNYQIIKQIGEGAFGTVHVAVHTLTRTKVVLKKGAKQDPNVVREIFFHRQATHSNITKLYEVIVTESSVYLALEYCSQGELYDYFIGHNCIIALDEMGRLFSEITGAVHYIHSLHIAHRDLKLENILLDRHGNCKLSDFGFARDCFKNSGLRTLCGTQVYMAPEILAGKNYNGFKIDMWALGVILYTLYFGEMPFEDDNEHVLESSILEAKPPRLSKPFEPHSAEHLISLLLQKNPEDRPVSLDVVLKHPFLQPHGVKALNYANAQTNFAENFGTRQFQSYFEKHLLRHLSRLGFDTKRIKESVVQRKCDSMNAMWYLLLEKENKRVKLKEMIRKRQGEAGVDEVIEASNEDVVGDDNEEAVIDDDSEEEKIDGDDEEEEEEEEREEEEEIEEEWAEEKEKVEDGKEDEHEKNHNEENKENKIEKFNLKETQAKRDKEKSTIEFQQQQSRTPQKEQEQHQKQRTPEHSKKTEYTPEQQTTQTSKAKEKQPISREQDRQTSSLSPAKPQKSNKVKSQELLKPKKHNKARKSSFGSLTLLRSHSKISLKQALEEHPHHKGKSKAFVEKLRFWIHKSDSMPISNNAPDQSIGGSFTSSSRKSVDRFSTSSRVSSESLSINSATKNPVKLTVDVSKANRQVNSKTSLESVSTATPTEPRKATNRPAVRTLSPKTKKPRPKSMMSTYSGFSQVSDMSSFNGTVLSMDTPTLSTSRPRYHRSKSFDNSKGYSPSTSEQSSRRSSFYDYSTSNVRSNSPDPFSEVTKYNVLNSTLMKLNEAEPSRNESIGKRQYSARRKSPLGSPYSNYGIGLGNFKPFKKKGGSRALPIAEEGEGEE